MKKALSAFALTFTILLTGCSRGETEQSSSTPQIIYPEESTQQSGSSQQGGTPQDSTPSQSTTPGSSDTQSGENDKATFLIGADRLPVYVSEITEAKTIDNNGESAEHVIPASELDEKTFTSASCGFVYVYDSRIDINKFDNPELFDEYGMYLGEDLSPSTEYRRIKAGDKVGSLTVRSAKTVFSPESELAALGSYLYDSSVYYDGELTVTGYLSIFYHMLYDDGMIWLLPTESPLPQMIYDYAEGVGVSHSPMLGGGSYSESVGFNLGYLTDVEADLNGLEIGDENVKVRAVIGNIRAGGGLMPSVFGELLSFEIL